MTTSNPTSPDIDPQQQQPPRSTWGQELALWVGVLGPPAAWIVNFQIVYALAPRVCATHDRMPVHTSFAVCLFVIVSALAVALGALRAGAADDPEFESRFSRPRFMAMLGVLSGVMFLLMTVAQMLAGVMTNPCPD